MTSMIDETALALSRWIELSILGKATILLAIGLTSAKLTGRARASMRHLLLTATFATLLALPVIIFSAPAVTIEVPISYTSESIANLPTDTVPLNVTAPAGRGLETKTTETGFWSALSWSTVVRVAWAAGAFLLLLSLTVGFLRLRRIRRDGLPWPELRDLTQSLAIEAGVRRSVEVLLHEDIPAPVTCGVLQPAIVLPNDAREWPEADLRRALVHELEHVRRNDWGIQLIARATCAVYWFHPLVWMAWRRLGLEAERACDDAVVKSEECTDYAEQLIVLARRMSSSTARPALGMANRSDLSRRVSAVLDGKQRRGRVGLWAAAAAISVASLVILSVAPVRAIAQLRKEPAVVPQQSDHQNKDKRSSSSTPLDRALLEAAENGDATAIDGLLKAGANVNCALEGDGSPLIVAARKGSLGAVRLLLDRGADINMAVPGDGNPLIMAASEGHSDVVVLLLDRGASIDQMVPGDENALIQASGRGELEVVKLLVGRGADVNARAWATRSPAGQNGEWRTPLMMARKGEHKAVVDFLLAAGARE